MSCGTITSGCGSFMVTVEVLKKNPTSLDAEGYDTANYSVVETLTNVDKHLISGEIAERQYGISDFDCKEQLFIMQTTTMVDNDKMRINGEFFEARRVLPWEHTYSEVLIKPYKGDLVVV